MSFKWNLRDPGWFKLNCDGSSIGNPGSVGAGAIIHNHEGSWIAGRHRFLGYTTNMVAELLARDLSITHSIVEVDATLVISLLKNML